MIDSKKFHNSTLYFDHLFVVVVLIDKFSNEFLFAPLFNSFSVDSKISNELQFDNKIIYCT